MTAFRASKKTIAVDLRGFTLVELLTTCVLVGLLAISVAIVSTSMLRSDVRMLQSIALRDNWKKIAQLINADIQEACGASVASDVLTLRVLPSPESMTNTCATTATTIRYFLSGGELIREGPRIKQDGTLSSGNVFLDSSGMVLSKDVSAFTPTMASSSSFSPTFGLTLTRDGVTYTGANSGSASAEGRVRVRAF